MPVLPALYSGVPTVEVEGTTSALLESSMTAMLVEEAIDGLVTCEVSFQNAGETSGGVGFPLFDTSIIDFGSELSLSAGSGDTRGVIFEGRVTGLTSSFPQRGTAELTVVADDQLQELRMTRRTRVFEDATDADIFSQVASDHGLTANAPGDGPTHRIVVQFDQSNLAFLRERARRIGAELWVDGSDLNVVPRAERRSDPVTLSHRQNMREAYLEADLTRLRTEIAVSGWDPETKQAIDVSAGSGSLSSELDLGDTPGYQLLEEVFGAVNERVAHTVPLATDEAQALAEARFRRQARQFVRGEVISDGDARLHVGATVELTGLGPWLTGEYDVVAVRHVFDLDDGFRSEATVERAGLAR